MNGSTPNIVGVTKRDLDSFHNYKTLFLWFGAPILGIRQVKLHLYYKSAHQKMVLYCIMLENYLALFNGIHLEKSHCIKF